jgi:hypothetical protein
MPVTQPLVERHVNRGDLVASASQNQLVNSAELVAIEEPDQMIGDPSGKLPDALLNLLPLVAFPNRPRLCLIRLSLA